MQYSSDASVKCAFATSVRLPDKYDDFTASAAGCSLTAVFLIHSVFRYLSALAVVTNLVGSSRNIRSPSTQHSKRSIDFWRATGTAVPKFRADYPIYANKGPK